MFVRMKTYYRVPAEATAFRTLEQESKLLTLRKLQEKRNRSFRVTGEFYLNQAIDSFFFLHLS